MNGEVVYIDITVNINDAVGIIYMINPVMARSALAGLMCGWSTLPQHGASRPGQGAFAP